MQRFLRQQVNWSPTLLISARNQINTALPLILYRGSRERLVLVGFEHLGQFNNTLTDDYQYSP